MERARRYCFSLSDVADDYAAVLAGKLPKPKVEALKVLSAALRGANRKEAAKVQPQLASLLGKVAMEPAPEVREAALQASVPSQHTSPPWHFQLCNLLNHVPCHY